MLPPIAPGRPLSGNLIEFRKNPLTMYERLQERQGKIVGYRLGYHRAYMVTDASAYQRVLRDNAPNYRKTIFYDKMKPLVGLGLLTSDGELWRKQRRLAQPSFHRPKMEGFAGVMIDSTRRMLDSWHGQSRVDVSQQMMDLTMDVVARSLLGGDVGSEIDEVKVAITDGLAHVMHKMGALVDLPESVPTPRNLKFRKALRGIERVVRKLIDRRLRQPGSDLLTALLAARDEDSGEAMSEKLLKDEVITMFLAGQETTATALTWTLYLLDSHPEVEAKLREEIASVLGTREPSATDIPKLVYLGFVIQESLRLYPPAWWYGRTPIKDDTLGGFDIPAGTILTLIPFLTHRNSEYWESPLSFRPERFDPSKGAKITPYSYVPFAAGPRMCIGKDFALIEMTLTLAMILQRYRLSRVSRDPLEMAPGITLRPVGEVWMTLGAA